MRFKFKGSTKSACFALYLRKFTSSTTGSLKSNDTYDGKGVFTHQGKF
jgi:hypothetical protein